MAVVLAFAAVMILVRPAAAQVNSCQSNSTPELVQDNTDVTYVFNITNTDSSNHIDWITITTPTSSFDILSNSADNWNSYIDATGAEFTGGDLAPGAGLTLDVEVNTGPFESGQFNWGIYAYGDSSSSGPGNLVCQDTTPTQMVDNTPVISNVNLSNETPSTVQISWTTDRPATSQVNYGLDDTYGYSTSPGRQLVTNHVVVLSSLQPNTGYHYQVVSTTPSGGESASADNTFLTAEQPSSALPAHNPTKTTYSAPLTSPIGITITKPSDNMPPKISLTNLPPVTIFQTAPTLTGLASDAVAIQRIEYSVDGGQNWLPVNSAPGLNTPQTDFSFTPVNLPDGTYQVIVRAINDGGYSSSTPVLTIVLDRLPPITGGHLLALGPQLLVPNRQDAVTSIAGVDQKITLSAVGGPTEIEISAEPAGTTSQSQQFSLTRSSDTQLWSGIVSIAEPGAYDLVSNTVDGAGVKLSQTIEAVNVLSDPHSFDKATGKYLPAKITLYYLDSDSHSWVVWDGSGYSENNPQSTDSHGNFKLFVPPGTYYLQAAAPGFETLTSSIFKINQSEPLTANLGLTPLHKISLGLTHLSLPSLAINTINPYLPPGTSLSGSLTRLIGQPLPDFNLVSTNGGSLSSADLLGRPTLVILGSTWSPMMSEQLPALSQLQADHNFNIVPIALQQSLGQVQAYCSIAGLNLNWLVDPDSSLTADFGSPYLPTELFVDRSGIIKQVVEGALSKAQIKNRLSGL
jgi:peroxiredoxin